MQGCLSLAGWIAGNDIATFSMLLAEILQYNNMPQIYLPPSVINSSLDVHDPATHWQPVLDALHSLYNNEDSSNMAEDIKQYLKARQKAMKKIRPESGALRAKDSTPKSNCKKEDTSAKATPLSTAQLGSPTMIKDPPGSPAPSGATSLKPPRPPPVPTRQP